MQVSLSQNLKELMTEHLGLMLLCMLLIFFSVFGQSILFGVYLPMIRDELDMSKTYAGALYASATIASAIAVIYTGKKIDEWPLRYFVLITLIMLGVGCLTLSFAQGAIMLFIAFFLLRQFGQGLMCLSSNTAVNRYLPPHNRGKAVALTGMGGPLHMMIFPVLCLYLATFYDWRSMWQIFAGLIFFVLIPLFWFGFKSHQGGRHAKWLEEIKREEEELAKLQNKDNVSKAQKQWTRSEAIKNWKFYALVAIFFLAPFTGTVVFFYQMELADAVGLTPIEFAASFPIFTVTSIIFSMVTGVIIDKYGEKLALIFYPIFFATGLFMFNLDWGLTIIYSAMFLIGAANGIMNTLGGPLLANIYGTVHLGAIKSALFSCNIVATALSPFLFGYFMDLGVNIITLFSYCGIYASFIWLLAFPLCPDSQEKH